jgi:hypothetical protein
MSRSTLPALNPRYIELLQHFDSLPLTATVPLAVAAAWRGVSEKTIRRCYPLVRMSAIRTGVRKADLIKEVA